jgi:cofilin
VRSPTLLDIDTPISSFGHRLLGDMAATGVTVADEVLLKFNDIKYGKLKARFVVYKIEDTQIVEDSLSMDGTYDDFLGLLPEEDCRYCLYDFQYETDDGRNVSKLCFISWCPDTAKVKSKMVYAGSKQAILSAMDGVNVVINSTDMSEVTKDVVTAACKKLK